MKDIKACKCGGTVFNTPRYFVEPYDFNDYKSARWYVVCLKCYKKSDAEMLLDDAIDKWNDANE